jgi:Uma2 family endonuclease
LGNNRSLQLTQDSIQAHLAVEVISPSDLADDVETKLDEYLRSGVRLVWVLYIPTKNVWAFKMDGTAKLYRSTDTLVGEDVLPGFAVPVAELFEGV